MAHAQNQSEQNRHLRSQSQSSHQYYINGNIHNTNEHHIIYDSELDLTHDESLSAIFVTDSSGTLEINTQNNPHNHTTIQMDRSNVVTSSFRNNNSVNEGNSTICPVCCDGIPLNALKRMPCCSITLCSSCLITHIVTNIRTGKAKIECPSCSEEINSSTILYNNEIPANIRERYQEILAQDLADKQHANIKLCPHCNFITILEDDDPIIKQKKSRRLPTQWIRCEQCTKEWCWECYAPSHPNETCKQFKKNHTQLDMWANIRRSDNQQRNAQRCPKCKIYIEKIDGCDHMLCSKCNSKFCYRCGSRMRLPFYIGHDAKYSVFGCRYKLWPDRPCLRWLVRGSIFAGVILLTPVVLAILIALVAIAIPIVLVIGAFVLPVYACIQCKKQS